jgi:outer membrane protein OmpA-like peptidoglycan-associated protein
MNNRNIKLSLTGVAVLLSACAMFPQTEPVVEADAADVAVQDVCPTSWYKRWRSPDQLLLRCRLRENPHLSVRRLDADSIVVLVRSGASFKPDNITPTATLTEVLDHVASALAERREKYNIVAVGHADNVGSPAARLSMSERRANVVRRYLIRQGVAESQIVTEGRGAAEPLVSNETPEGRAVNRRVDLVIRSATAAPAPVPSPLSPLPPCVEASSCESEN